MIFIPKSDFARRLEARFPNATPAQVAKLAGYDPKALPFRCSRCKTRPVLARAPVPESNSCLMCLCFAAVYGLDSSLPRNAKDWASLLENFDALKTLHRQSQAQGEANN
jgi:hypothetical protein